MSAPHTKRMNRSFAFTFARYVLLFLTVFASTPASAETKMVIITDHAFIPQQVTVKKNEPVALIIHNQGQYARKMFIPRFQVSTPFLMKDEMATIRFIPHQTGRFPIQARTSNPNEDALAGFITIVE